MRDSGNTFMIGGHFKVICKDCKRVIGECRCFNPYKYEKFEVCKDCEQKATQ